MDRDRAAESFSDNGTIFPPLLPPAQSTMISTRLPPLRTTALASADASHPGNTMALLETMNIQRTMAGPSFSGEPVARSVNMGGIAHPLAPEYNDQSMEPMTEPVIIHPEGNLWLVVGKQRLPVLIRLDTLMQSSPLFHDHFTHHPAPIPPYPEQRQMEFQDDGLDVFGFVILMALAHRLYLPWDRERLPKAIPENWSPISLYKVAREAYRLNMVPVFQFDEGKWLSPVNVFQSQCFLSQWTRYYPAPDNSQRFRFWIAWILGHGQMWLEVNDYFLLCCSQDMDGNLLDDGAHPLPLEKQHNFKTHPELTGLLVQRRHHLISTLLSPIKSSLDGFMGLGTRRDRHFHCPDSPSGRTGSDLDRYYREVLYGYLTDRLVMAGLFPLPDPKLYPGKCLDLMLEINKILTCPNEVLTELKMAVNTSDEFAAGYVVDVMHLTIQDLLAEVQMAFETRAVILDDKLVEHLQRQGDLSGLGRSRNWLSLRTGGEVHPQVLNMLPAAALH